MCLAIPMKIIKKNGETGVAEKNGVKREIFLDLVDVSEGDYVLLHAGIAIGKIEEEEISDRW